MTPIIEIDSIVATDADILAGTRLLSIPYNGLLTLYFSSDLNVAANHWNLTIQLPGGDVPVDNQLVLGNALAIAGVLDDRTTMKFSYPAPQGGQFHISLTETGAAIATWMAVLR